MSAYYEDDSVVLYHGDCMDVLPTLAEKFDVLLTDPPYFQVKDEDWDRQWGKVGEFLDWLGSVIDATLPLLDLAATAWVFAGPVLASRVEREVIEPRLRVLNSIRWVKEAGWHQKADIAAQRRYLTPWEAVIMAEQRDDAYGEQSLALHKQVFAPLGRYIQQERERAGLTRSQLEVALGYVSSADAIRGTALCYRWEEGSSLPTAATYERMRGVLGAGYLRREYEDLRREYEDLRREYEDLRREYEDLRRPFALSRRGPVTDVWDFPPVMGYPGKHPCEKPAAMLQHMIEVGSKPGARILDLFAGSGATLRAAKDTGRKAVGIEKDERWCERAAQSLAQDVLFGATA